MKPGPIAAIVLRQYYLMKGSPTRVLPLFAWVAVDIILWGFISRYLDSVSGAPIHFVANFLGAVLLWDFFTRVMQGITTAFLEDVWSRNFINLFATPLTLPEYLSGLVATSIVTSLIGLAVMLALAGAVFGLPYLAYGAAILPFMLILFLFGIVLGVLACAMVLRLGPASEWLVWPIPAMLSPFAAVFYPLSTLPQWMRAIAHLLPASYVFEGLRQMMAGGPFPSTDLLLGFAIALGELLLAGWTFLSIFRYAVRSGLLARYSAETAS